MQRKRRLFFATTVVAMVANQLVYQTAQAQAPVAWKLVQELMIDGNAADLTRIGAIVQSKSGEVYIAQPQDYKIKVFSSSGKLLRTIGRKGQGPGEFEELTHIGFVGDSLYTLDSRNRRVSLFKVDGKLIRTLPVVAVGESQLPSDTVAKYYITTLPELLRPNNQALMMPSVLSEKTADGTVTQRAAYRSGWNGQMQKKIATVPTHHEWLIVRSENRAIESGQPFNDDPRIVIASSGARLATVSADASTGKIRVVDISVNGDTLGTRTFSYTPQPIPARVVDSVVAKLQGSLTAAKIGGDARRALYIPKYFPAFSSWLMQDDGTLWLRMSNPSNANDSWTIISAKGQVSGKIELLKRSRLSSVANGIWVIELDSDDVVSAVRYRIETPSGKH